MRLRNGKTITSPAIIAPRYFRKTMPNLKKTNAFGFAQSMRNIHSEKRANKSKSVPASNLINLIDDVPTSVVVQNSGAGTSSSSSGASSSTPTIQNDLSAASPNPANPPVSSALPDLTHTTPYKTAGNTTSVAVHATPKRRNRRSRRLRDRDSVDGENWITQFFCCLPSKF